MIMMDHSGSLGKATQPRPGWAGERQSHVLDNVIVLTACHKIMWSIGSDSALKIDLRPATKSGWRPGYLGQPINRGRIFEIQESNQWNWLKVDLHQMGRPQVGNTPRGLNWNMRETGHNSNVKLTSNGNAKFKAYHREPDEEFHLCSK